VEYQLDHMPAPALQVFRGIEHHADRGCYGAGMDQVKPAKGDDAEEQLRGVAGGRIIQPQLSADGCQCLLAG
jgi:hypothetical protein